MKTLEELLRHLARQEVLELAMVSGRLPCVRIGQAFDPVDEEAPATDDLLAMLVSVGGSRYVDALGPTPKRWTARLAGLGVVVVSAAMPREGEVQVRFALAPSEPRAAAAVPTSPAAKKASIRPPARRSTRPAIRVAARAKGSLDGVELKSDSLPPPSGPPRSARPPRTERPTVETPRQRVEQAKPGPVPLSLDTPSPSLHSGTSSIDAFLGAARTAGATDVHIVAGRPLLLRIAGDLIPTGDVLEVQAVERMLLACVPTRLAATMAELGSCDFAISHEQLGRFRMNVGRQSTGLKATIRLIPREVPTLEILGLPPEIALATKHHQGLIVVTGPTGHGKTTTLAAIVDILNRETTAHIITVEDPIEFVHPRKRAVVSQREVGTHTRSFGAALKGSLREDPDVIVVGELRDTETVRMAVAASETGHLVIGTMNTPSAAKTIDRLIDLFPPADQPQVRTSLASGLRLIASQRLVPSVDRSRMFAAAELLPGSVPLSALIRDNKTFQIPSLQQRGKALGIIRLDDSLAALVEGAFVSLETAKGFADSPGELEALVAARRAPKRATEGAVMAKKGF